MLGQLAWTPTRQLQHFDLSSNYSSVYVVYILLRRCLRCRISVHRRSRVVWRMSACLAKKGSNDITVAKQANASTLQAPVCIISVVVYHITTSHAWKP